MLAHSPQATLQKKIIYNVFWVSLGQHFTRKLPVQCWPIGNRQLLLGKQPIQCCIDHAETTLHRNILSSQCCPNTSETTLYKKLLVQCWPRAHTRVFAGKPVVVSNMSGRLFFKWVQYHGTILVVLFNVGSGVHFRLANNIEHGSTLTGTV